MSGGKKQKSQFKDEILSITTLVKFCGMIWYDTYDTLSLEKETSFVRFTEYESASGFFIDADRMHFDADALCIFSRG